MYQKLYCHSEQSEESPQIMEDPSLIAQDDKKGFVAMTTVLILGAIVVAIAATVTLLSIDEAQSSLTLYKGEDNLNLVEGCVEDVMMKVRADSSYSGTTISRPEGDCNISYNPGGGGPVDWDITVTSSATNPYQRKITVVFKRSFPVVQLTSWKEI
ncbi:hypothetical protein HYU95_02080 [Candidatus Daviesbacteria bacterium]|nr:hypothetical protein [Candidatus Daviesbacteria bacterium]